MKKHIPNIITLSRIPMSVAMLFVQSVPAVFWTLYMLCGLSDVLDGAIARRTGATSRLGESLDTIADTVFVVVWMILFLPAINVGKWIWVCVGLIALVKVLNIVSGFIVQKTFVSMHTYANKATGTLLFLLPLFIQVDFLTIPYMVLTCVTATFAAIQEGHLIRSGQ